jgi:hypothetical protein
MNPADGKHKGFGFAEFESASAAQAALRNLNGKQAGSRPLRLAIAAEGGGRDAADALNPVERFNDVKDDRQILTALEAMSPQDLWMVLCKFKDLVNEDEARARAVLTQRPDIGQALLQIQKILYMLKAAPSSSSGGGGRSDDRDGHNSGPSAPLLSTPSLPGLAVASHASMGAPLGSASALGYDTGMEYGALDRGAVFDPYGRDSRFVGGVPPVGAVEMGGMAFATPPLDPRLAAASAAAAGAAAASAGVRDPRLAAAMPVDPRLGGQPPASIAGAVDPRYGTLPAPAFVGPWRATSPITKAHKAFV